MPCLIDVVDESIRPSNAESDLVLPNFLTHLLISADYDCVGLTLECWITWLARLDIFDAVVGDSKKLSMCSDTRL
jgi:hypothetical protein